MNVTMIPGYWSRINRGVYVLLVGSDRHEVARIFRGCARDVWVLCIGDYKHKAITGTLADAKAEIIAELGRRVRGTYPATMHFLQSRKEYEKACLSVARLCIIKESFAREIMDEAANGSQINIDPDPVGLAGYVEIGGCLCKMMHEIIGNRLILWTGKMPLPEPPKGGE